MVLPFAEIGNTMRNVLKDIIKFPLVASQLEVPRQFAGVMSNEHLKISLELSPQVFGKSEDLGVKA